MGGAVVGRSATTLGFSSMHIEIPSSVVPLFREAGWPRVDSGSAHGGHLMHHPSSVVLHELDGITVGDCERGEECATSDIAFGPNPDLQADPAVLDWQRILDTKLVAVAEIHHAHGALFVDSSGRYYGMSLVHDAFWFEGNSLGVALENLLLGRKARPMLAPGQSSVSLYGEEFTLEHPLIHRYAGQGKD